MWLIAGGLVLILGVSVALVTSDPIVDLLPRGLHESIDVMLCFLAILGHVALAMGIVVAVKEIREWWVTFQKCGNAAMLRP